MNTRTDEQFRRELNMNTGNRPRYFLVISDLFTVNALRPPGHRTNRRHGGRNVPRYAASRKVRTVRSICRSGPEEHEPDDREDQDREPGRYGEQRRHRRPGLALARLCRSFHDLTLVSRGCHGDLNFWLSRRMAATPRGGMSRGNA